MENIGEIFWDTERGLPMLGKGWFSGYLVNYNNHILSQILLSFSFWRQLKMFTWPLYSHSSVKDQDVTRKMQTFVYLEIMLNAITAWSRVNCLKLSQWGPGSGPGPVRQAADSVTRRVVKTNLWRLNLNNNRLDNYFTRRLDQWEGSEWSSRPIRGQIKSHNCQALMGW